MFPNLPSTTVYTPVQSDGYTCESSVVVITERCQRLNPGSSPGSRTICFKISSEASSRMKHSPIPALAPF